MIEDLFSKPVTKKGNVLLISENSEAENQQQTNEAFSRKWVSFSKEEEQEQAKFSTFQKQWYLQLYGFEDEVSLADYLRSKPIILDAGCGLGYKASWLARLAPESTVIGMDYSDAAYVAANKYSDLKNLFFVKGDISNTGLKSGVIDYVNCDQVIHHTQDPAKTYSELVRVLAPKGDLAVYVYAKKALPRELVDDYFREASKSISHEEMVEFSEQLTELGKRLSELSTEIDVPEIPLLDIKGGKMDVQRFIYWNFLKCFWNEDLGRPSSVSTNYDWYAPSNAYRYTSQEFLKMASDNNMEKIFLHSEEACHSGRFRKMNQR